MKRKSLVIVMGLGILMGIGGSGYGEEVKGMAGVVVPGLGVLPEPSKKVGGPVLKIENKTRYGLYVKGLTVYNYLKKEEKGFEGDPRTFNPLRAGALGVCHGKAGEYFGKEKWVLNISFIKMGGVGKEKGWDIPLVAGMIKVSFPLVGRTVVSMVWSDGKRSDMVVEANFEKNEGWELKVSEELPIRIGGEEAGEE